MLVGSEEGLEMTCDDEMLMVSLLQDCLAVISKLLDQRRRTFDPRGRIRYDPANEQKLETRTRPG